MTFVRRKIDVTITLGTGKFGDVAGDTITLSGHRVIAEIVSAGGAMQGQLQLKIYGLPLSTINQLTTIGATMTAVRIKNKVQVAAGDEGSALSLIYEGVIDQAWGEFQSAPDVCFSLTALSALDAAMKPVGASSFNDPAADVATIMAGFAADAGYGFENHGVAVKLSYPYFPGTTYEKIKACAKAAGISFVVEHSTLAIWPNGGVRTGQSAIVSPGTGMIGYPVFSSNGVGITTLFNPTARLGGQVEVESSIKVARGIWNIVSVQHSLESERPGGGWFTYIGGRRG